MAKAKKSEVTLTLEEKLEQALVADWEQPYKVPENWCWVRMGKIGYTNIGLTYKPSDISEKGTIVLRSSNIQDGKIDYSDIVKVKVEVPENKMSKKGDILICARNGSKALVGKTAIIDKDGMSYGVFMAIYRSNYNRFIFHYLNSHYFRNIIDGDVGTTTINQVTQALIKDLPLPFPPLAEQQRIVDRIERMFSKLDEVKENVQNVIDGFENRKSAILHKAFNGDLTAKWRKENHISIEEWCETPVNDVCTLRSGSTIPIEEELEKGKIPYIKVSDMNLPENSVCITTSSRFVNECTPSRSIPYGSTIFPKRGGAILTNKKRFVAVKEIIADLNTMAIIPDSLKLNDWYCYYWMLSIDLKTLNNGSNVPQINNKDMFRLSIPVPSLEEQTEIASILEVILSKEQQAKEIAENVLERIEIIKKSILARAFRGELGTNNPDEESSLELLKMVLSEDKDEKRIIKSKSIRVSIPVEIKVMLSNHFEKDILKLFYKAESNEVSIDDIMSVSSNKFEIMDALKALKKKKLISKKANGIYKLAR